MHSTSCSAAWRVLGGMYGALVVCNAEDTQKTEGVYYILGAVNVYIYDGVFVYVICVSARRIAKRDDVRGA